MKVVNDRVLIEKIEQEQKTVSGILLPNSKQKLNQGKVIMVGPEVKNIHVGDIVRTYPHYGIPVDYNKMSCLIVKEDEIEFVVK